MAVDGMVAAPAPLGLDGLERTAWRIPLATRRLFVTVAVAVVAAILAASLAAAWVASRNAGTVADARETGLEVARAATELRLGIAAADAQAASTLLAGGTEDPEARRSYVTNLAAANQALTDAALVATGDDRDDVERLAVGLANYSGLVETARANARQGFPVGAAYLDQARALARDELVPTADHLRRVGEQRVARAANSVGGPLGVVAVGSLVLAVGALVASGAVVAGRSRRLIHPALVAAAGAAIAALVVVTAGIVSQSRELRAAATGDIDAYVAANDAAFDVSNMRVAEISAVAARGSGAPRYEEVRDGADRLLGRLADDPGQRDLAAAVDGYAAAVDEVRAIDLDQGDNRAATESTLEGDSAAAFEGANAAAADTVERALTSLDDRFEAASDAKVSPVLPIVLGVAAAGLAAAGTLARARRYR